MNLTELQVGILASVLTEILKFIPQLNAPLSKAVTALIVAFAGAFFFTAGTPTDYASVVIISFVTYKALVQPAAVVANLSTQK